MFSVYTTQEKFENGLFTLKTHQMFSVYTTPEKFENGLFTLKTHQVFSVYTAPEKFENGLFTLKTHQMFPVYTIRRKDLKTQQDAVILDLYSGEKLEQDRWPWAISKLLTQELTKWLTDR